MRKTLNQSFALALTSALASWLTYFTACLISPYSGPCRQPGGGFIVIVAAIALVLLWISSHQRDRLRQRLRRGMYSRVSGAGRASTFERAVKFVLDGKRSMPLTTRVGWWVDTPIENGTRVWVGQDDMWEWLVDVNVLRLSLKAGASPIARSKWEPIVGKLQWDARCRLLVAVGAAGYSTDDKRSRRLIRFDMSGILKDMEGLGNYEDN